MSLFIYVNNNIRRFVDTEFAKLSDEFDIALIKQPDWKGSLSNVQSNPFLDWGISELYDLTGLKKHNILLKSQLLIVHKEVYISDSLSRISYNVEV